MTFFNYTKSEIRGFIILLLLIIILVIFRYHLYYGKKNFVIVELKDQNLPDVKIDAPEIIKYDKPQELYGLNENTDSFRLIDINKASISDFMAIGISPFVSRNIVKYRTKAGDFSSRKELLKIYGFDSLLLSRIEGKINISRAKKKIHSKKIPISYDSMLELNSADTSDLKRLRGIGSVLSQRIIRYRKSLGGFYSVEQLSEVYGISDSLYLSLNKIIKIDTSLLIKLNINNTSIESLQRHPYLNRFQSKAIFSYFEYSGSFTSTKQLIDNHLVSHEVYEKVHPYLRVR